MGEFATYKGVAGWAGQRQLQPRPTVAGSVLRGTSAILFALLGVVVQAAQLTQLPDLKSPAASEEKRVSEIREIGLSWWLKNRGLLAEESFKVAGYFSVARPIADFAARDDRVWEVRVLHLHTRGPTGILWINDKTEKVIALGAEEKVGASRAYAASSWRSSSDLPISRASNSCRSAASWHRMQ
jgi:hypothetical protein